MRLATDQPVSILDQFGHARVTVCTREIALSVILDLSIELSKYAQLSVHALHSAALTNHDEKP